MHSVFRSSRGGLSKKSHASLFLLITYTMITQEPGLGIRQTACEPIPPSAAAITAAASPRTATRRGNSNLDGEPTPIAIP